MSDQLIVKEVQSRAFPQVQIGVGHLPKKAWVTTYRGSIMEWNRKVDLNRYIKAKAGAEVIWTK